MIPISKGSSPKALEEYRGESGASYDNMPKEVKDTVLEQLLQEQHHLCAYCTCRIPEKLPEELRGRVKPCTIEHVHPQKPENEADVIVGADLDYKNMLAVCSGGRGFPNSDQTCDARKGNRLIRFRPTRIDDFRTIKYMSDGTICSDDEETNRELNDILALNSPKRKFCENRLQVWVEVLKHIKKSDWKRSVRHYSDILKANPTPFCGMALYKLERLTERF